MLKCPSCGSTDIRDDYYFSTGSVWCDSCKFTDSKNKFTTDKEEAPLFNVCFPIKNEKLWKALGTQVGELPEETLKGLIEDLIEELIDAQLVPTLDQLLQREDVKPFFDKPAIMEYYREKKKSMK